MNQPRTFLYKAKAIPDFTFYHALGGQAPQTEVFVNCFVRCMLESVNQVIIYP